MNEDADYEISESDIEVAMRHLKFSDPKHATREKAIALLEELNSGFHGMAHDNPERLLGLKKRLKGSKDSQ